jgi:3-oxoacyl-[acyl-carrier protein] reductase
VESGERTAPERQTMVITGSSRGIGRALADHYLRRDFFVYGCSRRLCPISHPRYRHFELDAADEPAVLEAFARIREERGALDVLLNNAGVGGMNHLLLTPMSSVEGIMRTNFAATVLFSREAAKLMKGRERGRIVNFSSVAVPLRLAGEAVYAASKAAVETLTEILARELSEFRITVNAVGPTPVETDLIRGVGEERIRRLLRRQAISRLGEVSDIVNVVDFFIRPESDFVTGQILYLGGVR